ncbi:MAG: type II toxin-antitoxin system VapC family toxin [Armatimonadetes bacterium]|nr:type II toxin-antitoxin system VapC family toxin [Armatimonadota bacterium]
MTDGFVLDASLALTWSAAELRGIYAEDVLRLLESQKAHVPCHWRLEVTNLVLRAQDAGSLSAAEAASFLSLLNTAPIDVDDAASKEWILTVRALASRLQATSYEAAYIELCQRLALPLATEDTRLRNLARSANVDVLAA